MKGVKGTPFPLTSIYVLFIALNTPFTPSPHVPGLQYVRTIDNNGPAAIAGLCTGDFIIEVGYLYHS